MKAYSVDLRQQIIDAHNQQEGSQRQLAKRFRVSLTFIENLLKRYRTDGTVEPLCAWRRSLSQTYSNFQVIEPQFAVSYT